MTPMILAGAATALFGGITQAGAEDKRSIEQNKAVQAYNKQLMLQQAKNVGQINAQRALTRERTAASLFNITQASTAQQAQVQQASAAADTIGASVQDAVSTINTSIDRAVAGELRSLEQAELGFDLMLEQGIDQTKYSFQKEDYSQGAGMLLGAFGQAAGSVATSYGMEKLAPAGGTKPAAPTDVKSGTGTDWWGSVKSTFGFDKTFKQWNTWK